MFFFIMSWCSSGVGWQALSFIDNSHLGSIHRSLRYVCLFVSVMTLCKTFVKWSWLLRISLIRNSLSNRINWLCKQISCIQETSRISSMFTCISSCVFFISELTFVFNLGHPKRFRKHFGYCYHYYVYISTALETLPSSVTVYRWMDRCWLVTKTARPRQEFTKTSILNSVWTSALWRLWGARTCVRSDERVLSSLPQRFDSRTMFLVTHMVSEQLRYIYKEIKSTQVGEDSRSKHDMYFR